MPLFVTRRLYCYCASSTSTIALHAFACGHPHADRMRNVQPCRNPKVRLVGWLVGFFFDRIQHGHLAQFDDVAIRRKKSSSGQNIIHRKIERIEKGQI